MMTIAMPSARMPRTETERTIETIFSEVKKPGNAIEAAMKINTAMAKTIFSWLKVRMLPQFLPLIWPRRPPSIVGPFCMRGEEAVDARSCQFL
jgi:hypothetical protein